MDSADTSLVQQKIRYFCSYQERCIHEVKEKLKEWAVQEKKIPAIINQLQKENYLNEERFAKAFAGGKFRLNKWGRRKIEFELARKGVPELTIQEGLLEIDQEEYIQALKEIILHKSGEIKNVTDVNLRQKIVNFAAGKGFEINLILSVIKELKI